MATNTTEIAVETINDQDFIILQNDQALTTSLKVAECFGKRHTHVLRNIENSITQLTEISRPNFGSANLGFIQSTYKDAQGKDRIMYYLNRDAFTFIVMGFTGIKATTWKWRYIQAFNRMEQQLRAQRPMKPLEILQQQVQIMIDHEQRLQQHDQDIRDLTAASNSMFWNNRKQQSQLNRHEEDIVNIKNNVAIKNPRTRIKTLIDDTMNKCLEDGHKTDYGHLYAFFYNKIKTDIGFDIFEALQKYKEEKEAEGWSNGRIKKITILDIIDQHKELWSDINDLVTKLREHVGIEG